MTLRRAPRSLASATARSTAAALPEMTCWPSPLSLASSHTPPAAAASAPPPRPSARRHPGSPPWHPRPAGTASCIACAAQPQQARRVADARWHRPRPAPSTRPGCARRHSRPSSASRRPVALLERAHGRERGRHQRRLGVRGQRQPLERALEDQRRERLAQRLVDLVEHGARGRARRRTAPGPCPRPGHPAQGTRRFWSSTEQAPSFRVRPVIAAVIGLSSGRAVGGQPHRPSILRRRMAATTFQGAADVVVDNMHQLWCDGP